MHHSRHHSLWDLAGVDGLKVAMQLFGNDVGYLAPFQSMETVLQGKDCSVLRLCDRNFRIVYAGDLAQLISQPQPAIWLTQFDWLGSLCLPISELPTIMAQATVRPPHRLDHIPNHQAVPAQFAGMPILIWHHPTQGKPTLELHLAHKDLETLGQKLNHGPCL
ncbi:hypothetical protein VB741_19115 [Leptothoe sp. PORK10 BA2]|nr:hypothetical protein [Leptothoe sp. PORK10 BA2]